VVKIGFEIHVQLNTRTKLFCGCLNADAPPNTHVCEVCTAQPGAKPGLVNKRAVEQALKVALLLQSNIHPQLQFMRKHYFYPDLPANYQRTSQPIATGGQLEGVRIREVHIEEDPGRYDLKHGLVDFNRSGVPLVEIVTEPDVKDEQHALRFLNTLKRYLLYAGVIKPRDQSTVKLDVNVSVGQERVEIKNVNSFYNVALAIKNEIVRQRTLIEQGLTIQRETRHFDEHSGKTFRLRTKETADDYRYMYDPDLPVITLEQALIDKAREETTPHPTQARALLKEKGVKDEQIDSITQEREVVLFLLKQPDVKRSANVFATRVKKQLNYRNLLFRESYLFTHQNLLSQAIHMFLNKEITDDGFDAIIIHALDKGGEDARVLAQQLNVLIMKEEEKIKEIVNNVIKTEQKAWQEYKAGNKKALSYLLGKVMKMSKGRADPHTVIKLLEQNT